MDKIKKLQDMINECSNIVFFSGAGVSTESGIKDFRSPGGLYSIKYKFPPEYMLSHDCLINNTNDFFEFYRDYLNCLDVKPNIVHNYLKKLEDSNKLLGIVTQNIDGLHTKAGNKNVYEIHGTVYKNYCMDCDREYPSDYIFKSSGIPHCACGGIVRPRVVLYGEMLPEDDYLNSIKAISKCDMLIVAGTSLTVYPASGLVNYFNGKYLVIINRDSTDFDKNADLVINDNLGNVFSKLK